VVLDLGAGRVRLDRLNALLGVGLRLVSLTGSDDLAVRGLQVESELARLVFADLELGRHASPSSSGLSVGHHTTTTGRRRPSFRFGFTPTRYSRNCVHPRHALAILPTFGYQRRDFVVVLHIIWLIILGLVVGLIARAIVPGRQPMGWIATAVLGIVGAYVGGTLGSVVFPPHQFDIHPPIKHSFLGALVGAVLLLVIYKVVTSRTRTL
jgi:uncharacterized membrane protein YeaQ/YmgE (transglycosylase-associated protein family)